MYDELLQSLSEELDDAGEQVAQGVRGQYGDEALLRSNRLGLEIATIEHLQHNLELGDIAPENWHHLVRALCEEAIAILELWWDDERMEDEDAG